MGQGPGLSNYVLGQKSGVETVSVNINQIPLHTHTAQSTVKGSARADSQSPAGSVYAADASGTNDYATAKDGTTTMAATFDVLTLGNTGGSQPHENLQPYLCVNFIIALVGVFPSRN